MPTGSSPRSGNARNHAGLQALSVGCEVDLWTARTGVVHSVFPRAANLLVDGEMWSLLGAGRHDAPFGIRLAPGGQDCGALDLKPGDGVHIRAGYIQMGRLIIDGRTAARWAPRPWQPPAAGLPSRLDAIERVARPRAWAESAGLARRVTGAFDAGDVELAGALRRSVGLGPGMTPAGDDVLVGMLTVFSSGAAGAEGARITARLTAALAPAWASTNDVSRHLLAQAARGLPARAIHDLGAAVVEGANGALLDDALQVVLGIGCTSGADACTGMIAACRFSFLDAKREAA